MGRAKGLTGRRQFDALQTAYEAFRHDGRLPATYEVVFGHAWMPAGNARRGAQDGATVSLDDVREQLRSRRRP
jgi:malonyl-CoA O-methyltransferase